MKIFFDTEFYEDGKTIELISIGVVREDGAEYYAETRAAEHLCSKSEWLQQNVLPHLQLSQPKPRKEIAEELVAFAGDKPEWWAWYADYDWVVLCQLFGRMIDLPKGWPKYCRDLKQLVDWARDWDDRVCTLPKQLDRLHHALADARWLKAAYDSVTRQLL